MKKSTRWIGIAMGVMIALTALSACGGSGKKVVVASKQFTENILLSEIYAQLIEAKTDIKVERKQNLGGTSVCFPGMEKGEIDIYVEYSGTAYNEILKMEGAGVANSDEIYQISQEKLNSEYGVTMFSPIGINNTFALAMLRTQAEEKAISSMSDLAALTANTDIRFGANHIFYTRELDGYDKMVELYGMKFSEALKMDTSLLYDAIEQNQLDVMVVYATDSLLKKYDMVVLQDDKEMFPAYHGAPICRNEVLETYPELREILDLLKGRIDDARMQALDYEIDVNNQTPEQVAKQFIEDEGLLQYSGTTLKKESPFHKVV